MYRRRQFLRLGTATTAAALAGCSAFDDGNDAGDERAVLDTTTVPGNEWHSFQRTPGNDGYADGTTVSDDPSERWRRSLSAGLETQPVVGSDRLYALTADGTLRALDAASGETVWTESLGATRTNCPCLVDDLVVAGTGNDELIALDVASGDAAWTVDLPGRAGDPTPYAGIVYVGTDEGSVVGVDANSQAETLRAGVGGAVKTAPAVTDEQLYIGIDTGEHADAFLALGRTSGEERWRAAGNDAEVVVAAGRRIVTVDNALDFYTPDGSSRGQSTASAIPAVTPEAMYYGGDVVSALNLTENGPDWGHLLVEGENIWTITAAPASVADGTVCVPYATTNDRERTMLLGLDAESGDQQFERELPSGEPTAAVLADDAVFVGTDGGDLLALE